MIGRRDFLRVASGAGAVLAVRPGPAEAEPPPETKKLTLALTTSIS